MAIILNIETSSEFCSIALARDGRTEYFEKDSKLMNHAVALAPMVKKCLDDLKNEGERLDAVSVSLGPGSYTGLRIGLSLAKGLAYSLSIPLIGISTLKILAVKAMFEYVDWEGVEKIIPMIDARRMEVYTACYNARLDEIINETSMILDDKSFEMLAKEDKVIFIGNGSEKFKPYCKIENAIWMGNNMAEASDMSLLSERAFLNNDFIDIAYSVPNYLKEYRTTQPKNKCF